MGNRISPQMKIGTLGELLVQLRLLQYNVQAAPPIKDSGNDLIAVRGERFRSVQIKTTTADTIFIRNLPQRWHILALVFLRGNDNDLYLDNSIVKLFSRNAFEELNIRRVNMVDLRDFDISSNLIDNLFPNKV